MCIDHFVDFLHQSDGFAQGNKDFFIVSVRRRKAYIDVDIAPFVPTQLLEFLSKRRYLVLSGEIGFGPSAPRRAAYAPAAAPSPRAAKQRPIQRKTFQGVIRHGGSVCPSSASQYRPTTNSQDQDDQCDMSTGTVIVRNMLRVTPPSTNSRKREWP